MERNQRGAESKKRKRKQWSLEFKLMAIRKMKKGLGTQLGKELGVDPAMLYHWRAHRAELMEQRALGSPSKLSYHNTVSLLRRALRRVTAERDILKKAVSYFANQ